MSSNLAFFLRAFDLLGAGLIVISGWACWSVAKPTPFYLALVATFWGLRRIWRAVAR